MMLGQMIILPITAPDAPGAVRLKISDADVIAASMPNLSRMMSPKNLTKLPGGGVSGNCQVSGQTFIQKGPQNLMTVNLIGGKPALGFTKINSAGALAWQPGSASQSYTLVTLINQPDPAGRCDHFTMASGAGIALSTPLRYFPDGVGTANKFISYGADINNPFSSVDRPSGDWAVLIVDYDDYSRTTRLAVNSLSSFSESTRSTASDVDSTSYVQIGYAGSSSSLRNSNVGDTYYFNDSLLRNTTVNLPKLQALVDALKIEYGIL